MPSTTTYVPLITQTLNSSASSVTLGSGGTISQAYTDLVLVITPKLTPSQANLIIRFNGDSGSNYSWTAVGGNGSSASSIGVSNQTQINVNQYSYPQANNNNITICHIFNYSNSTTYKTMIARGNNAAVGTTATVGMWRGSTGSATQAITSITITLDGYSFDVGSTFTLYGIANADTGALATGGVITYDSTY